MSTVLRLNILNGLTMISEYIHSNHSVIEVWVLTLEDIVVGVFFVIQSIQSFEDKFEHSGQVLWGWSSHKDVAEPVHDCRCD